MKARTKRKAPEIMVIATTPTMKRNKGNFY